MPNYREVPGKGGNVLNCYEVDMCVPPCGPSGEVCYACDKIITHRTCRPTYFTPPKPGDRLTLVDGTEGSVLAVRVAASGTTELEAI